MYRAIQFVVLTAVVLFGMSTVAQAGHIPILYNVTDQVTVFDTDFELPNNVVGSVPGLPIVGTAWTVNTSSGSTIAIANSTTGGCAPNEGAQFLQWESTSAGSRPWVIANGINDNSGDDDLIEMTLAIRQEGNVTGSIALSLRDVNGAGISQIMYGNDASGTVKWYNGNPTDPNRWTNFTATAAPDAWHTLVIRHQNGTSAWSISIDGSDFEAFSWSGASNGNWSKIWTGANGDGYEIASYDAVVPEPSTLALLATGLIGLLCYAWRKRK